MASEATKRSRSETKLDRLELSPKHTAHILTRIRGRSYGKLFVQVWLVCVSEIEKIAKATRSGSDEISLQPEHSPKTEAEHIREQ